MTAAISDSGISYGATAAAHSLFPIRATVASNAITVTLDPTTIAFRDTTLTTGTPVTLENAAALTLTIAATDSFGLTTAFGTQRLAILCFNDAGTMRLAATALYGGVKLDETNLLSATATATTATAIDAGMVITSKAYKVVGFVDAPFTTAVGWGSLALVQGAGGQAMAAMSSLGYGQTWQSFTGSKTSGTTYYNTTGKPIIVALGAQGISSSAILTVNGVVLANQTNGTMTSFNNSVTGVIPAGAAFVGIFSPTILFWSELR